MPKRQSKGIFASIYDWFASTPSHIKERSVGVVSGIIGIFLLFSVFEKGGVVGNYVDSVVMHWFGYGIYLIIIFAFFLTYYCFVSEKPIGFWSLVFGSTLGFVSIVALLNASINEAVSGTIGAYVVSILYSLLGWFAYVLLPILLFASLYILRLFSPVAIYEWAIEPLHKKKEEDMYDDEEDEEGDEEYEEEEEYEEGEEEEEYDEDEEGEEYEEEEGEDEEGDEEYEDEEEEEQEEKQSKTGTHKKYIAPPLSLLEKGKGKGEAGNTKAQAIAIQRTLKNFNIDVEVEEITVGPTFTRYAMRPAEGVRLSKIVSLQNNLELALAAHSIRIEAPIPGKSLVGIEVPNESRAIVGLRALLESKEYTSGSNLFVAIGKTIQGKVFAKSLAKMPHVLIAGTTGSGKSVLIHNFVLSLMFRHTPEELRFIFIDPKRVELTLYNNTPHLYTDTITHPKKALQALVWAVNEMERRYELLEGAGARDITSYNKAIAKKEDVEHMPYIAIVIDEMADLMHHYPREIEAHIVRLAQKSRAVGIHLILATQRPSVNVITGVVKANIPVRIACRVASQIDSRTILDSVGAESLIGAGDLLFLSDEHQKPVRIQSAFVTEDEVKKVAAFLKKSNGLPTGIIDVTAKPQKTEGVNAAAMPGDEEEDELYEEAKEIVISTKKASTSLLQRKLKIGYARAARLIDLLESRGIVGPQVGSKPRDILTEAEE